jgi:hypothetical protein
MLKYQIKNLRAIYWNGAISSSYNDDAGMRLYIDNVLYVGPSSISTNPFLNIPQRITIRIPSSVTPPVISFKFVDDPIDTNKFCIDNFRIFTTTEK